MTRARSASGFGLAAAAWALAVPWLGGFAPTGLFALVFVALARGAYPGSRLARMGLSCLGAVGVAYLVTAVFPCDPGCPDGGSVSQTIHSSFGLIEYVGAIAGFVLLAVALRDRLGAASAVAAGLVVLGLAGMLTPSLANVRGLSQRTAELGIFGWIAYASLRLRSASR